METVHTTNGSPCPYMSTELTVSTYCKRMNNPRYIIIIIKKRGSLIFKRPHSDSICFHLKYIGSIYTVCGDINNDAKRSVQSEAH